MTIEDILFTCGAAMLLVVFTWVLLFIITFFAGAISSQKECDEPIRRIEKAFPGYQLGCWSTEFEIQGENGN